MQGWAHQQELEEQWYYETDFTVDREHYFSGNGDQFTPNQQFNKGE